MSCLKLNLDSNLYDWEDENPVDKLRIHHKNPNHFNGNSIALNNGWVNHAIHKVEKPIIDENMINHLSSLFSIKANRTTFKIPLKFLSKAIFLCILGSIKKMVIGIIKNAKPVCKYQGKRKESSAKKPPVIPAKASEKFPMA